MVKKISSNDKKTWKDVASSSCKFFRNIRNKSLKDRALLLCKIFVIGLMLQFFLQTFVTYKLWWDWKFWTAFWMWKEFILLIFVVILWWYVISHLSGWIKCIKNRKNIETVSWNVLWNEVKPKFITQFILIFIATLIIFFLLAVCIQRVGLSTFVLSFKYDLVGFFIFWIWLCLALAFFTEEDKNLLELYRKVICWSLWLALLWWFILWFMPTTLRHLGFNPEIYEWTVWQNPPAVYYTKIIPFADNSHIRNTYLFERPTSFGFWLIAFFPIFVLWYLRNKRLKDIICPVIIFGLLVFSTWSRAWLAVWALEAIVLFFILYWNVVKKHLVLWSIWILICLWWLWYLWRGMMVREHSNTWHLVLMQAWWNLAKENLITWWWAWYAWPASHQICYTEEPVDVYADVESITLENKRCEVLRKSNVKNQISTYGFNPENQYLQILIEYGIVWILFWLGICVVILWYTWKMVYIYRNKVKSPYQELLYYCLLWFGIWFVWLCVEWLVLHSLVDRMIVYPFFLLYGITVWLWEKVKDEPYVVVNKKSNKKKWKGSKRK